MEYTIVDWIPPCVNFTPGNNTPFDIILSILFQPVGNSIIENLDA